MLCNMNTNCRTSSRVIIKAFKMNETECTISDRLYFSYKRQIRDSNHASNLSETCFEIDSRYATKVALMGRRICT